MLEDAIYQSQQTPGHHYHPDKADKQVYPKGTFFKIIPSNKKKSDKIVKSREPDVGTYSPHLSYKKTQLKGSETKGYKMLKNEIKPFTLLEAH